MANRIWADVGIDWATDEVGEQAGPNKSDWRKIGDAQLPVIVDLDKAKAAGIDILALLNASNSPRVRAQAMERDALAEKPVPDVETRRERIFNWLKGVRNGTARTVTVVKRPLPDGTFYEGNDETEFRQLYAAGLVDVGVPEQNALAVAKSLPW